MVAKIRAWIKDVVYEAVFEAVFEAAKEALPEIHPPHWNDPFIIQHIEVREEGYSKYRDEQFPPPDEDRRSIDEAAMRKLMKRMPRKRGLNTYDWMPDVPSVGFNSFLEEQLRQEIGHVE